MPRPVDRLVNHGDADANDSQGPNGLEAEVADAQIAQQQQDAPAQHDETPEALPASSAAAGEGDDAAGDEHGGPEIIEDAVSVEDALLVEQQDDACAQNQRAEKKRPAEGSTVAGHYFALRLRDGWFSRTASKMANPMQTITSGQ